MRFVAAQFEALLAGDLWLRNATHANEMAQLLAKRVDGTPGVAITRPPEVNAVFATIPPAALSALQAWSHFYVWDEVTTEVRWMTSFDTTTDDVERFAAGVGSLVDEHTGL
jgi:threonine aldolase